MPGGLPRERWTSLCEPCFADWDQSFLWARLWWCCAPNSSLPSFPRAGLFFLRSLKKVSTKKPKRRSIETKEKQETHHSHCRGISTPSLSLFLGLTPGDTNFDTSVLFHGGLWRCISFFTLSPQSFVTTCFDNQQFPWAKLRVLRNHVPSQEFLYRFFTVSDSSLYLGSSFSLRGFWNPIGSLTKILFPGVLQCLNWYASDIQEPTFLKVLLPDWARGSGIFVYIGTVAKNIDLKITPNMILEGSQLAFIMKVYPTGEIKN